MSKRNKRKGPGICVDEHIVAPVAEIFRRDFSVIEAAKSSEFKGRNERDYMHTLYERNIIFVTSDFEFIVEVADVDMRHAGMVYIPAAMSLEDKKYFADIARAWIKGGTRERAVAFRGNILYPAHDGVRFARRQGSHGKHEIRHDLAFSWDWLNNSD